MSCDTEDWSNDAENSGLHPRNKLHLTKSKKYIFNCNNISRFYCNFDQINAALVSRKDFSRSYRPQTFEQCCKE